MSAESTEVAIHQTRVATEWIWLMLAKLVSVAKLMNFADHIAVVPMNWA